MANSSRAELFTALYRNRILAHEWLFKQRHPDATPDFHEAMVLDFHNLAVPNILNMVFRGGGKSTITEEGVVIGAAFREFKNCIVIGETYERAAQRLHSIRNEIELNERLRAVFGDMMGAIWAEDRIVTASGVMIQAMGRGQSLRGIKHLDMRPDFIILDDILGRGDVTTPENRKKAQDWVDLDLLPACDPRRRVRCNATPLHPEDAAMMWSKSPEWVTHRYPIYYLDPERVDPKTGRPLEISSWPERFAMRKIKGMERDYTARGNVLGFKQEYMVEAEAPEAKPFKREMIRIEPRVRTWQAVYAMIDPARTAKPESSATTGVAVWSWFGTKLVVWDAWASYLMPDAIVSTCFEIDEKFHPVVIGIEADGLNEFLMQPIRQESVRRGVVLPVKAMKAPRGKYDFIRGLQPFYQAREVEHVRPLPDLETQLLGFPTGLIDAPNALAYALMMRPGSQMYDEFGYKHILDEIAVSPGRPAYLCLNATDSLLTGVLCQNFDGSVRILADFVLEGDITASLPKLLAEAQIAVGGGRRIQIVAGPSHFDRYRNVGLRQAASRIPKEVRQGLDPLRGRTAVRHLLERERANMPMLMVSSEARWTLNGFAGGYAKAMQKGAVLADFAEEGVYKTLIEGFESFVGLLDLGGVDEDAPQRHYEMAPDGRRYLSARASRG